MLIAHVKISFHSISLFVSFFHFSFNFPSIFDLFLITIIPRVPSSLCPSSCSGQGFCAFLADVYRCVCDSGYSGDGCETSPTASSLWSIGLSE
uniref:EGF-like domain-containing protein n=1 Tax=Caenorhabditis japonica TaxID=281687 RepID=A0A8R1IWF5_CAEJA